MFNGTVVKAGSEINVLYNAKFVLLHREMFLGQILTVGGKKMEPWNTPKKYILGSVKLKISLPHYKGP